MSTAHPHTHTHIHMLIFLPPLRGLFAQCLCFTNFATTPPRPIRPQFAIYANRQSPSMWFFDRARPLAAPNGHFRSDFYFFILGCTGPRKEGM
uniref:Putative secreted protein n=1 Tax=Anopheles triannulatus TaxID=58253 RepID=A0A2M4B7R3_9DIPT